MTIYTIRYACFVLYITYTRVSQKFCGGSLHGAVANVLNCDIATSEFKLQSCYYTNFQTNILEKGMNFIIPPWIVLLLFFYKNDFGIK